MAQKFDINNYRMELVKEIAEHTKKVEALKALPREKRGYEVIRERQNLEVLIQKQTLMLNPMYMCEYCYSDRHAYEVIRLESAKQMAVRQMSAKRVDNNGMSDSQEWHCTPNPNAPVITLRLHKNGCWYESGNASPFGVTAEPYEYYDFSF